MCSICVLRLSFTELVARSPDPAEGGQDAAEDAPSEAAAMAGSPLGVPAAPPHNLAADERQPR